MFTVPHCESSVIVRYLVFFLFVFFFRWLICSFFLITEESNSHAYRDKLRSKVTCIISMIRYNFKIRFMVENTNEIIDSYKKKWIHFFYLLQKLLCAELWVVLFLFSFLLLFFFLLVCFGLATICGDGWVQYESNCYLFLHKEMDFLNALVSKLSTKFGWYYKLYYIKENTFTVCCIFNFQLEIIEDGYAIKKWYMISEKNIITLKECFSFSKNSTNAEPLAEGYWK